MHASRLAAMAGAVTPEERNRLAPGACVNGRDATWVDRLIATHDASISIREPGHVGGHTVGELDADEPDAIVTARVLDALLRACALRRLVRGAVAVGLVGGPMDGQRVTAEPDASLARFLARNGYTNVTTFGVTPGSVHVVATHDGVERGVSRDEVARQVSPTTKRTAKRSRR